MTAVKHHSGGDHAGGVIAPDGDQAAHQSPGTAFRDHGVRLPESAIRGVSVRHGAHHDAHALIDRIRPAKSVMRIRLWSNKSRLPRHLRGVPCSRPESCHTVRRVVPHDGSPTAGTRSWSCRPVCCLANRRNPAPIVPRALCATSLRKVAHSSYPTEIVVLTRCFPDIHHLLLSIVDDVGMRFSWRMRVVCAGRARAGRAMWLPRQHVCRSSWRRALSGSGSAPRAT